MKKIILIDDEPLARLILKEYLSFFKELEIVAECNDGFEGIKAIGEHKPDLIFLDIQMPKISGFEMLELLENPPAVIFTTAFDEYALKAFDENAIDYLLKPFSKERFDKAIKKWMDSSASNKTDYENLLNSSIHSGENQRVVVKTGTKIRIIPAQEILYLEAYDDFVKIHTADGIFLKNKTMAYFEKVLVPSQFTRVHRSYIVKLDEITKIEPMEKESHIAILRNGDRIPVSKSGYAKLKESLGI